MDDTSSMRDYFSDLGERLASRVHGLRTELALSLEDLARKSGVSRSMISLIERAETSPTAVVLDKLAAGLNTTLSRLLDAPAAVGQIDTNPVSRRDDQTQWRDPSSGYVRRNVSPIGVPQPMQITEVHFPPGGRVAFENTGRDARVYQQIWMLEGNIEITVGEERHHLGEGDCLAMQLDGPTMFHNPTAEPARYAVVIACENRSRKR
jgi:transcriptional regulator with XRE-family HTH domain